MTVRPKRVVILGSTGSIGINTLKVIERFPEKFKVVGLSAFNNFKLLAEQTRQFHPLCVAVNHGGTDYLRRQLGGVKIFDARTEISAMVKRRDVDIVVLAIRGSAALEPFLDAVRAGKTVAPANKEALVIAGHILMPAAKKHQARIIPVDSEQSAIFQCLEGRNREELKKIYLTASGGPLRKIAKSQFDRLTIKDILKHPRWKMGKKITVDSATLMNKGLEVIEAKWLFNVAIKRIEVLIHPEAVIHSMIEFKDGSIIAQLGVTDMRLPIQYALTYPRRFDPGLKEMDFLKLQKLTFAKPDLDKFPALKLAYAVGQKGGSAPCVLNAANEEAVDAFLNGRIRFSQIFKIVEKVVGKHKHIEEPSLTEIQSTENWAREEAQRFILN